MCMPETAMHLNALSAAGKCNVWSARNLGELDAESVAKPMEQALT